VIDLTKQLEYPIVYEGYIVPGLCGLLRFQPLLRVERCSVTYEQVRYDGEALPGIELVCTPDDLTGVPKEIADQANKMQAEQFSIAHGSATRFGTQNGRHVQFWQHPSEKQLPLEDVPVEGPMQTEQIYFMYEWSFAQKLRAALEAIGLRGPLDLEVIMGMIHDRLVYPVVERG
jgi:hypothetical protein